MSKNVTVVRTAATIFLLPRAVCMIPKIINDYFQAFRGKVMGEVERRTILASKVPTK